MNATRQYPGCYRVSLPDWADTGYYGLAKKVGREWHTEIRFSADGTIKRYAGIWKTLTEAISEIENVGH